MRPLNNALSIIVRFNLNASISSLLVLSMLFQSMAPFLGVTQAQTLLLRPVTNSAPNNSGQLKTAITEAANSVGAPWLEPIPPPLPTTITDTVVTRHAPTFNSGQIEGSLRVLLGESFGINGNTQITSDLYLPGTPTIQLSGGAQHGGTLDDGGSSTPTNYTLSLSGSINLPGKIHTRADAITLPSAFPVAVPLTPGTRTVTVNSQSGVASIGDWQTVRDLNVKGGNITIDVPPGNYRTITVNGNSRINFTAGTYNFSNTLTLDGSALLQTTGAVTINIARNLQINSGAVMLGRYTSPGNLQLNVLGSAVDINGSSQISGLLRADNATVTLNGKATLQGQVIGNTVVLNGGKVIGAVWPALNGVCPTVFGPRRYVRTSGNPNFYVEQFALPAGLTSPFTLHIQNGASDGTQRISSASLKINGVDLLASNDLSQNVASLDRTLSLGLNNQLDMEIQGSSGYLTLNFCGTLPAGDTTPPAITISSPANNSSTTATQITVTGSAIDSGSGVAHVYVNNSEATYNSTDSTWTINSVPLVLGENQLTVRAVDQAGNESTRVILITRESPANHVPTADAGSDQTLTVSQNASLQGVATDDGLPSGSTLSSTWSQVSGPGTASFVNANALATTATFTLPGTYVLRLTVTDGALSAIDDVTVIIQPTNQPPTVIAGADQTIALPLSATLEGMVTDDGLPAQSTVDSEWTKVSGPGSVTFGDSSEPQTTASFSLPGAYVLRLTASDSQLFTSADVTIVAYLQNQAPTVSAGPDQTISLPNGAPLNGNASDDFAPAGSNLTTTWSKVSGPAAVTFDSANSAVTVARFTVAGTYVLRLSASDGDLTSTDDITITVTPPNQAPTVNAGVDQIISLPADTVNLSGSVTDDQLPTGSNVSVSWSKVSGPGSVTFGNATNLATTAQFSVDGDYVLRLTATDSDLSSSDEILVKVTPPNQAPTVEAGANQAITLPAGATLNGSVSDDGLPLNSSVSTTWSKVSGPGTVTFTNANTTVTDASFSTDGTYVLRLSATDGNLSSSDDLTVTVIRTNQAPTVNAGADQTFTASARQVLFFDDFESGGAKWMDPGSMIISTTSALSGTHSQTFGRVWGAGDARSTFIPVNPGQTYVLRGGYMTLGGGGFFGVENFNASQQYISHTWFFGDGSDFAYNTWPYYNINNTPASELGRWRVYEHSYVVPAGVFFLRVITEDWIQGLPNDPLNHGVFFDNIELSTYALPQTMLTGTISDDGLPQGSTVSAAWSVVSGPGTVTFSNPTQLGTNATFSAPGTYVLRLSASDSALNGSDDVTVTVLPANQRPDANAGPDQTTTMANNPLSLNGTAVDDGLPSGVPLVTAWSLVNAKSLATFAPLVDNFDDNLFDPLKWGGVQLTGTGASLLERNQRLEFVPGSGSSTGQFRSNGYTDVRGRNVLIKFNGYNSTQTSRFTVRDDGAATTFWATFGNGTITFMADSFFDNITRIDGSYAYTGAAPIWLRYRQAGNQYFWDTSADGVNWTNRLTLSLIRAASASQYVKFNFTSNANLPPITLDDFQSNCVSLSQFTGPGTVSFSSPNTPTTTVTFSDAGIFLLRLIASDSELDDLSDALITVHPANQAPTISINQNQNVTLPFQLGLNASVFDDGYPVGSTLTQTWTKQSGPGTVTFANASSPMTTASFSASGFYVLRLTASDSGLTNFVDVTVNVYPANTACLNDDLSDDFNDNLLDPGKWTIGAPSSTVTIFERSQQLELVLQPNTADYNSLSLVPAFDLRGKRVQVEVKQTANQPIGYTETYITAGLDGANYYFMDAGSGSLVMDSYTAGVRNRTLITYAAATHRFWRIRHDPPTASVNFETSSDGVTWTTRKTVAETFPLNSMHVSLVAGAWGTGNSTPGKAIFDNFRIMSLYPDCPPAVALTSPAPNATFAASSNITFTATASPSLSSGSVTKVEFFSNGTKLGETSTSPYSFVWNSVATGSYSLTAKVTDDRGATATSTAVPVTVFTPNQAPSSNAGTDQTITLPNVANLQGAASDDGLPSGTLSTTWSKVSGPGNVSFANASSLTTTATFTATGVYVLRLTANDSALSTSDDVQITVNPNVPPTANAGPDQTVTINGNQVVNPGNEQSLVNNEISNWTEVQGTNWTTANVNSGAGFPEAQYGSNYFFAGDAPQAELRQDIDLTAYAANIAAGTQQFEFKAYMRSANEAAPDAARVVVEYRNVTNTSVIATLDSGPITTTSGWHLTEDTRAVPAGTGWIRVRLLATRNTGTTNDAFFDSISLRPVGNAAVKLNGVATDVGLPTGSTVTATWTKVSGPSGITFSNANSAVTTATFTLAGTYVLRLMANDGQLTTDDDVTVVVNPANVLPSVNAGTSQTITLPVTASLSGTATDDGQPLGSSVSVTWSKAAGPGSVSFSNPNAVSTTATFSTAGVYILRLTADDSEYANSADVTITVNPAPPNQSPTVNAGADQTISLPIDTANLNGSASDDGLPFGSSLTVSWTKVSGPGAVTFGDLHAAITTAQFSATGTYVLRLSASDGDLSPTDDVTITVTPPNESPTASAGADQAILLSQQAILNGSASDDGLPYGSSLATTWTKVSGPGSVTFGNPNVTVTTAQFSAAGEYVLRLTSNDGDLSAHDDLTVTVNENVAPPTVEITSPADGSDLTAPTPINGTVSNGEWVLEYSLNTNDGSTNQVWTQVATGNGPLTNEAMDTLDTTLMLNGIYSLRLKATDQYGQTSFTSISVLVDKNFKVGQLQLAFSDLSVPVGGLPIEVIRSYDSRDNRVGDFGVGWQLGIRSARVEKTGILGLGWTETVTSGFIPTYCLEPARPHKVAVTFGDGKVFKFLASTATHCQQAAPISSTQLTFTPEPGTHASLEVVGTNDILVAVQGSLPGPVQLLNQSNPDIFNTGTFRLTTDEGVSYVLNQLTGVSSVRDPYGNTLTITASGITHSSGQSVSFTRDNLGRITQITDPSGNPQTYTYDGNGDLVTFADRENHATTFTYNSEHHLLTIVDARGINLLTNQYDSAGRLIGQTDAFNKSLIHDHNVGGRVETITDRLGHETRYEYYERGNVLRQVDAKGGVKTFTYDAFDNVLTETNPLGKTTTYTYDAADNRTSVTDPLNNVTQFTYNGARQVLTVTDPRNKVTTNTYDAAGTNLLTTTDPLNNTTTFTYNLFTGQRTTMKDALNHVTQYGYDANGRLTTETDALNNVTTYGYDTYGNRTSQTVTRTNAQGQLENITTTFTYDKLNRLTRTTFVDGSFTRVEYNEIGQQSATVDQLNHRTEFTYDEMGRLKRTDYADGTHDETTYDEEGRRLTSKDRSGRTTSFEYDELGRLTKTTYPDNTFTSTTYDAAGEVLTSTDARGKITRFEYDDAGRRTKVKNALNQETTFTYDPNGNQLTMTDALSHTTTFEYDAINRRTKTIYEDSSFDLAGYDELGRNVSKTDQAGKTTQFIYDDLGRLKKVKDALNQETNYTYNELGQQLTQTDANNHTTHFEYDQLGRRVKRILPAGQFETYSYDTGGNLESRTDFNGKTTTFTYDLMRRLLTKVPDASLNQPTISFTYKPSGQRATMNDVSGTTVYNYDVRNRLESKQTPFGTLSYTYDDAGNLLTTRSSNANGVSVDYSYDDLNRLSTVKDNRLVALNGGITSYGYDPVGNLESYLYPNGVTTSYHYNSLNRLTSMNLGVGAAALSSYTYTLGAAGNRTAVAELSGRTVNYTYDDLYRLTNETITNDPHGINGAVGYGYDPVGNRLSRTSTLAGVPATTSTYNANDRLTSDSYDNNGNTTSSNSNSYAYDFENHLTSLNTGAVTYIYDGDGNRVAKTIGGTTTNYLVDTNNTTGYAQVVDELQNGAVTKSFTYGHDLISQRIIGSTVSFYSYDGHGSVRLLTDASAAITDTYDYDAFGNLVQRTGTTSNDYLYCGEQFDANLGFYYLRARFLNTFTGRFVSMDSFEGDVSDPTSLHKYTYANNDPSTRLDPSGNASLSEQAVTIGISGVLNAIACGSISYIFSRLRGINQQTAFREAVKAGGIGFLLAIPWIGTAVGLYFTAGFIYAACNGDLSGLDYWEFATYLVVGLALRGISTRVAKNSIESARPLLQSGAAPQPARVFLALENGVSFPDGVQGTSGRAGDFTGLRGADPIEVLERIPSDWTASPADGPGGVVFRSASNPKYDSVRIMPGDATSPWQNSRGPYLRLLKNGSYVDDNGLKLLNNQSEGHIPLKGNPAL